VHQDKDAARSLPRDALAPDGELNVSFLRDQLLGLNGRGGNVGVLRAHRFTCAVSNIDIIACTYAIHR
jgi:hypothetical protein